MAIVTWNEIPNGIATCNDPELGGIIDQAIVSKRWFIIFNSPHIDVIEDFATREEAFAAHEKIVRETYLLD